MANLSTLRVPLRFPSHTSTRVRSLKLTEHHGYRKSFEWSSFLFAFEIQIAPSFEKFLTPKYAENAGVGTKVKYSDNSEQAF